MASYDVTLCGSVDYRGTYVPDGLYGGKDSWKLDATHYLFWCSTIECWGIDSAKADPTPPPAEKLAYYNQTSDPPDGGTWQTGTGAAPPPTVTAAAGGGGGNYYRLISQDQ